MAVPATAEAKEAKTTKRSPMNQPIQTRDQGKRDPARFQSFVLNALVA